MLYVGTPAARRRSAGERHGRGGGRFWRGLRAASAMAPAGRLLWQHGRTSAVW